MNCPTTNKEVPLISIPNNNKIIVKVFTFFKWIKKKHKTAIPAIKIVTNIFR